MQDLIHISTYLECDSHLDRQSKKRLQNRRDMISPSGTVDKASGRVLCSLESVGQSTEWTITVVGAIQHKTTYCGMARVSCQQVSDFADQA